jgi:hypothetical protein
MTWYNYTPLAPLIEKYSDDGSRDLLSIDCDLGDDGLVAAIGERNTVQLIRVETVNGDGNLTAEQGRTVAQLVDHMITVLRFTTNQYVEKLWFGQDTISMGSHGHANGRPSLEVKISEHFGAEYQLDCKNISAVFSAALSERDLFKLLGDGQQATLPLQYKYLSFYKVLEHEFREGKKWALLGEALAPWENEFRALEVTKQSLQNFVHALRDKCAHIKIGSSNELGFTGLSTRDMEVVEKVMPILKKAISAHLTGKYPSLRFTDPSNLTG